MDNINDKYPDLYRIKEYSYGTLNVKDPVIVFMDGIGITRNHKKYNMLNKDGFIKYLSKSALKMMSLINIDAVSYISMDEVSFVFYDTEKFIKYFEMDNVLSYIESVFLQKFCRIFHKYYPEVDFKMTMFNITENDIPRWIQYRKDICTCNAEVYVAKEFLPKHPWKQISSECILNLLKENNLYDSVLMQNKQFYCGLYHEFHPDDIMYTMSKQLL